VFTEKDYHRGKIMDGALSGFKAGEGDQELAGVKTGE